MEGKCSFLGDTAVTARNPSSLAGFRQPEEAGGVTPAAGGRWAPCGGNGPRLRATWRGTRPATRSPGAHREPTLPSRDGTGSSALRPVGGCPEKRAGRSARNACRHATCARSRPSSGKRLGEPLEPEFSLVLVLHRDLHDVSGTEFSAEESLRERILDVPFDHAPPGVRAEDRVVALDRED